MPGYAKRVLGKLSERIEELGVQVQDEDHLTNEIEQARWIFDVLVEEGEGLRDLAGFLDLEKVRDESRRNQALLILAGDGVIYVIAGIKEAREASVHATMTSRSPGAEVLGIPREGRISRDIHTERPAYFELLDGIDTARLQRFALWPK